MSSQLQCWITVELIPRLIELTRASEANKMIFLSAYTLQMTSYICLDTGCDLVIWFVNNEENVMFVYTEEMFVIT